MYLNHERIKVLDQNEKYIYVVLYFQDKDYIWHEIKAKIPKHKLKEV